MPQQKHALVVDDSKAARLVLRRMLEKYGLRVDTVESGAEALEYLRQHRPDVVFMDHMMPGMDGFEAVRAIKDNPDTATIPVMMYTSKGSDLYLGQARALGAVGVLPKTVAPAELFESLRRIGLVEDRRSHKRESTEDMPSERAEDVRRRSTPPPPVSAFTEPGMRDQGELDEHLRKLLDEQRVELRKDLLLGMESVSKHTAGRLDRELDEKLEALQRKLPSPAPSMFPVILLSTLLFGSLAWNYSLQQREAPQPQAATVVEKASAPAAVVPEPPPQTAASIPASLWQTIAWAMNRSLQYDYDQIALDEQRVDLIDKLVEQLAGEGFHGKLVLETHAGEFCLLGGQESGFRLPPPELTVDKCDFIGNPVQPTDSAAAHQSLRFANFSASNPLLNGGPITLEVIAASRSDPLFPYPPRTADTTAQQWNRVAAQNNRVLVQLEPGTPREGVGE